MSLAEQAASLFQQHREELGFVNTAQCEEKDLYTVSKNGELVGAALCNHCVRKPQTTLYDIAVLDDYRRTGIATELINKVSAHSPHDKILAKCPKELPANEYYDQTDWKCVGKDNGKNRALNIWQLDISNNIDVITTGRVDLTEIASKYGVKRGTRLDSLQSYENAGVSPDFIDIQWENPDQERLLTACEKHTPEYAVAGDYDGTNYKEINKFAERLSEYVENVIIVPHEPGEVDKVPKWAVVGYSTPTQYAGTTAPIWEYYGRDVHILGGRLVKVFDILGYLGDDVVSCDSIMPQQDAVNYIRCYFGHEPHTHFQYRGQVPREPATRSIELYESTICNMTYQLREMGLWT